MNNIFHLLQSLQWKFFVQRHFSALVEDVTTDYLTCILIISALINLAYKDLLANMHTRQNQAVGYRHVHTLIHIQCYGMYNPEV